ncbi:MAG TPA: SDR family oxidoreductase [Ramlibacter sp.]|uniref:SDR family oxidoreductase n=1 Tax=Ramlibacter sp. TaxID=1917967 RepID=UPI002CD1CF49|nr:SDR family oxidoreductase [Ramlibacter sp.]HVZ44327.1 SDR family oxidoreductase [Ramlibacter sp.]
MADKKPAGRGADRARDSAHDRAHESAHESAHDSDDPTVEKQRALQREQDRKEPPEAKGGGDGKPGPQTGTRGQPQEIPAQHLQKPGVEADMQLKPRFEAPDYRGSGKLKDRVALVTGGDSGIGRAVSVLYAREGADVAIVYLASHEDAEETKRHVEREGRKCLLIPGDVKDPAFCEQAVEKTVRTFGRLDILVNNAAFQLHAHSLEDITDERLKETVETNIFGYFFMARAAVKHLKEGSCIINTGSVVGLKGSGELLDYSATKGAIHALTMSLAQSLIDKGIRVNAVAPGPVWTPLNPADRSAEEITEFGKSTVFKRPAQPEELSPAYVFLASPVCASFITGIVLPVTGQIG